MQNFRVAALSVINNMIPLTLHYIHNHPESLSDNLTKQNYQQIILNPWVKLSSSPFSQIKTELSAAVCKLVIDYGHIMGNGWQSLLIIIRKLKQLTGLQAIVQTYLQKIQKHIEEVIDTIDQIERNVNDSNQKYLCLTLIWTIGDYSSRRNLSSLLKKIYALLLKPEQMFALGTQARHSSFYILAQLLVHNCSQKAIQFWSWVFDLIQKFSNYAVQKCISVHNKIGVEQVVRNLLTNLLKIYRKSFLAIQQREFLKSRIGQFFNICQKLLCIRNSDIYQSTLRQVRQMLTNRQDLAVQTQQFISFLQKLTQIYIISDDVKILKSLITYLPNQIYQIITHCLSGLLNKLPLVYKLFQKVFLIRLEAQEKDVKLTQLRIFFQDRTFMEFFKKFHATILNKKQVVFQYMELFIITIHKLVLYEDYTFIGKFLPFLSGIHQQFSHLENIKILELLASMMQLRNNEQWRKKYQNDKEAPVWLRATYQFVKISHNILSNYQKHQSCKIGYRKALVLSLNILFTKNTIVSSNADYISNYYDMQCYLLYFVIQKYLLHEEGTQLINKQSQKQLLLLLKKSLQSFKDAQPSIQSKSTYDMLFKVIAKKQKYSQILIQRQLQLLKLTFSRIIFILNPKQTFKKQFKYENELKYILKKIVGLKLRSKILLSLYQYLSGEIAKIPNKQSQIWCNQQALTIILMPIIIDITKIGSQQIKQLGFQLIKQGYNAILQYKNTKQ